MTRPSSQRGMIRWSVALTLAGSLAVAAASEPKGGEAVWKADAALQVTGLLTTARTAA